MCLPGQNTSLPTLIFESDGSHGIGDWFGILNALQKDGDHKVCVWDKPGLGFSDYLYAFQTDDSKYYDQLVASLMDKEPEFGPPFIFVGCVIHGDFFFQHVC